jgi:hypothetical protein
MESHHDVLVRPRASASIQISAITRSLVDAASVAAAASRCREEAIGKSVTILIPADRPDEEPEILERIRRCEVVGQYETVRQRKNGSLVEVPLTVSPVKNAEGKVIGASKIARNITERKRADEHRRLMIQKLNHRVKNTLVTVQSMAMQTLRNNQDMAQVREQFGARIIALAKGHDILTQESWEGRATPSDRR